VAEVPAWFTPTSPEPAATDYDSQEANQFLWMGTHSDLPISLPSWAQFAFGFRADLEARAGGNPSWNTGVNYTRQLERSGQSAEVEALYQEAGLNLDDDLAALAAAPRIEADPPAVAYLTQNIVFDGDLGGLPVLTIHTTADGLVVDQNEQAYRSVVRDAKDSQLLRQAFVHRAGHCTFTPAETIAAFDTLVHRVDTGEWTGTADPVALNSEASALAPTLNVLPAGGTLVPTAPAYLAYEPTLFLRTYDLGDEPTAVLVRDQPGSERVGGAGSRWPNDRDSPPRRATQVHGSTAGLAVEDEQPELAIEVRLHVE
jgi:hypothetical protein